jgi:hypothetical protein
MPIRFPDRSGAEWTPKVIAEGETFHVPANKQVLFAQDIDIEGDLVIDGDLVEVS